MPYELQSNLKKKKEKNYESNIRLIFSSYLYVGRHSVYKSSERNNNENHDGFDCININSFYKSKESRDTMHKVLKQMAKFEKHKISISRLKSMIL